MNNESMSTETAKYILDKFDDSVEVFRALCNLETFVLGEIDARLPEVVRDWFGDAWTISESGTLQNDYIVYVVHRDWKVKNFEKKDECVPAPAYLFFTIEQPKDLVVWKMFGRGLPWDNETKVKAGLTYWPLRLLSQGDELLARFSEKMLAAVGELGLSPKKGQFAHVWEEITLDPHLFKDAIDSKDWNEALRPVHDVWKKLISNERVQAITKLIAEGR